MNVRLLLFLLIFSCLPLVAQEPSPALQARERVYAGMVADEYEGAGLVVRAVAPASPAHKAGICVGDVLLQADGIPLKSRRDLRQLVAKGQEGQGLTVELQRGESRLTLQLVLELRPVSISRSCFAEDALGAVKRVQPVRVPVNIREEIFRHRRLLLEQLAALPDGLKPSFVTEELNAIRNLARDAHATRPGWMVGVAGEISIAFRDEEGTVALYGANNLLSLELYNPEGQLIERYELNTEAERRALPAALLQRLRRFR